MLLVDKREEGEKDSLDHLSKSLELIADNKEGDQKKTFQCMGSR